MAGSMWERVQQWWQGEAEAAPAPQREPLTEGEEAYYRLWRADRETGAGQSQPLTHVDHEYVPTAAKVTPEEAVAVVEALAAGSQGLYVAQVIAEQAAALRAQGKGLASREHKDYSIGF